MPEYQIIVERSQNSDSLYLLNTTTPCTILSRAEAETLFKRLCIALYYPELDPTKVNPV